MSTWTQQWSCHRPPSYYIPVHERPVQTKTLKPLKTNGHWAGAGVLTSCTWRGRHCLKYARRLQDTSSLTLNITVINIHLISPTSLRMNFDKLHQWRDHLKDPLRKCVSSSFTQRSNFIRIYLHDLEGAVGRVEELELFDGALGNRVEGGTTPTPLHQTDGLCCKHTKGKPKLALYIIAEKFNRITRE